MIYFFNPSSKRNGGEKTVISRHTQIQERNIEWHCEKNEQMIDCSGISSSILQWKWLKQHEEEANAKWKETRDINLISNWEKIYLASSEIVRNAEWCQIVGPSCQKWPN